MDNDYFEAEAVLGIAKGNNLTIDLVNSAYRCKIMSAHPDRGGSAQDFIRIEEAKTVLLEEVKKFDVLQNIYEDLMIDSFWEAFIKG
jgi:curved DNA-binding protein CbpA